MSDQLTAKTSPVKGWRNRHILDEQMINLDDRAVSVGNKPVHLTGKEYGVLECSVGARAPQ